MIFEAGGINFSGEADAERANRVVAGPNRHSDHIVGVPFNQPSPIVKNAAVLNPVGDFESRQHPAILVGRDEQVAADDALKLFGHRNDRADVRL